MFAAPANDRPPEDWYLLACEHVNWERVFSEHWASEQRPDRHHGMGLLQFLMVRQRAGRRRPGPGWSGWERVPFWLTPRERVIVATAVQWLGTNCGMGFLHGVFRECGLAIVDVRGAREEAAAADRRLSREVERLRGEVAALGGEVAALRHELEHGRAPEPAPVAVSLARFAALAPPPETPS